jgi:hypothetical protein
VRKIVLAKLGNAVNDDEVDVDQERASADEIIGSEGAK